MRSNHFSPKPYLTAAALLMVTIVSTGCANLERNLQDPNVLARVAQISERTSRNIERYERSRHAPRPSTRRAQPTAAPQVSVSGQWLHSPKTVYGFNTIYDTYKTNVITATRGGLYAAAKGSSARQFYEYVGNNTYRSSKGQTYTFTSANKAVWRGGSKSIALSRKR